MIQLSVLGTDGQVGRLAPATIHDAGRSSGGSARRRGGAKFIDGWKTARLMAVAAAFVILFAGMTVMRSFADESAPRPAAPEERIVIVDAGDTLWSIAAHVKRDGLDTREAIYRIQKRNGLDSASLRSGDRLIIPANVLAP